MSDLDSAIAPKRRKMKSKELHPQAPVTQEVTHEPVRVVIAEAAPPEKKLSARTVAEIERGRRALAEIAKQRAGK